MENWTFSADLHQWRPRVRRRGERLLGSSAGETSSGEDGDSNSSGAPSARSQHSAVWTGTEMIIWGGTEDNATGINTGGKYNSSTNSWTVVSTDGAPTGRYGHTAIWTGTEMIVWGENGKSGDRYNPVTNTWSSLATTNAPLGFNMDWKPDDCLGRD